LQNVDKRWLQEFKQRKSRLDADEKWLQEYLARKKSGTRIGGVLVGRNTLGKYLMAIREEILYMMDSCS
jgi:predicted NAD-dependent protein-ADP-ribosyltransferase YbiA (DUF1768 family)